MAQKKCCEKSLCSIGLQITLGLIFLSSNAMIQRYFEVFTNFGTTLLYMWPAADLMVLLHSLIKPNQWKTLTELCVFDIFCCLEQIHETLNDLPHFLTSGQQFSRLKGEEVGNWSGLISYPDDGGMKPARNGRKRYKPAQIPLNTTTNTLERQWERMPHRQWSAACMSGLETHPIPSANQTSRKFIRANQRTRTD